MALGQDLSFAPACDEAVQPYRIRIGVVGPDDGVNDDELWRYGPPDVSFLWTRYRTAYTGQPISVDMVGAYGSLDPIREAALTLTITRPQASIFYCNSCTFVHGMSVDAQVRSTIAHAAGGEATTVTFAQLEALRHLNARRVAVVGPYPEPVTRKLVELLRSEGMHATGTLSCAMTSEWQIGNTPPAFWTRAIEHANSPGTDAVLLACSGVRLADEHHAVESRIGKPVVTALSASVWHALRLIGRDTPGPDARQLRATRNEVAG